MQLLGSDNMELNAKRVPWPRIVGQALLIVDYDVLGRLDDFDHTGTAPLPATQDFTYDANGNRASIKESATTFTYTYDASGNVTNDGLHAYNYDDRGRLVDVDAGAITYEHNGQGQRVRKISTSSGGGGQGQGGKKNNSTEVLLAYDEDGKLIGEYDDSGHAACSGSGRKALLRQAARRAAPAVRDLLCLR